MQLEVKDATQIQTVHSDGQGVYAFPALHEGVYSLRVVMKGFADTTVSSLFLSANESRKVDLTLGPETASPAFSAGGPKFFDEPQFTVSGIIDTSNLGGHGSDTIVRTRETLAKDTASLGTPPTRNAPASEERSLRAGVEKQPGGFDANYRLGRLFVENGRSREAIAYLEQAARAKPTDYENSYELALAYADAGDYSRARDKAQTLLQENDRAELHHLLADVDEKLDDSLEAVRQYERAAEMNASENYLFDWGSELLLHHAPEPAIAVFTKGHRLFPRSARMLIGLGAAWFTRGDYEKAGAEVCDASDLNPRDPAPYLFLGKMQRAENVPSQEVLDRLHRFVTLEPQNAPAHYYYAVALSRLHKGAQDSDHQSEAESLLKNALRIDPNFAPAHLELGILHSEQGDYSTAISDYERAIQGDPQLEEAHYRLAQAYRQLGNLDKARDELRIYEQLAKESAEKLEREHREIRQFVYTLRGQRTPQTP